MLPDGNLQLIADGMVTRLDIAVDIIGFHLEELLITVKQMQAYRNWAGPYGELETVYCRKSKGNQVAVYDRAKWLAKHENAVPVHLMTRIEYRHKKASPDGGLIGTKESSETDASLQALDRGTSRERLSVGHVSRFPPRQGTKKFSQDAATAHSESLP